MQHRMHYYNQVRGLKAIPAAKCLCGAALLGEEEIAEHAALMAEAKKISAADHE